MEETANEVLIELLAVGLAQLAGATLMHVAVGIVAIPVVYFLFRLVRLVPQKGAGVKLITVAWLILALPSSFAFVGMMKGLEQQVIRVSTDSLLVKEVVPQFAEGSADLYLALDRICAESLGQPFSVQQENLYVDVFLENLEKAQRQLVEDGLDGQIARIQEETPILQGEGNTALIANYFLAVLLQSVAEAQMDQASKNPLVLAVAEWKDALREAAKTAETPGILTPLEMQRFTTDSFVNVFILDVAMAMIKPYHFLAMVGVAMAILIPALVLAIWNFFRGKMVDSERKPSELEA